MYEVWVRPNRRAIWFGAVPPAVSALTGLWLMGRLADGANTLPFWLAVTLFGIGVVLMGLILSQLWEPRVAYRDGEVLFYLRSGRPIPVPLELVEAFFLGQGPLMVKGASQGDVAVNLVARISQRDLNYARREVKQSLGSWCDSYVTIRGMWCEPLNNEVIRRLNRRLREVSEERSGQAAVK